jgi:myosin-5
LRQGVLCYYIVVNLISDQFEAMTEELDRRREECIQLKAVLSNRNISTSAIARESYHNDPDMINDDGELAVAYKTMKDVNRYDNDDGQCSPHQLKKGRPVPLKKIK